MLASLGSPYEPRTIDVVPLCQETSVHNSGNNEALNSSISYDSDKMCPVEPIRYRCVLIGAGFGGVGMGVALKNAGEDDFLILKSQANIGGI